MKPPRRSFTRNYRGKMLDGIKGHIFQYKHLTLWYKQEEREFWTKNWQTKLAYVEDGPKGRFTLRDAETGELIASMMRSLNATFRALDRYLHRRW